MLVVAWSAELCRHLWLHSLHRGWIAVVVLGSLLWCFQVGRLWRSWSEIPSPLRLYWTGDTSDLPHWRVLEWGQSVSVRIMVDLQGWMLLRVHSLPSADMPRRTMWSWVRGTDSASSEDATSLASAHRLRVLLYQSARDRWGRGSTVVSSVGPFAHSSQLSSDGSSKSLSGFRLIRSVFSRFDSQSESSRSSVHPASAWAPTEFPATQWLPRVESLDDIPAIDKNSNRGGV